MTDEGLDFQKPYRMTITNLNNGCKTTETGTADSLTNVLKLLLANTGDTIDLSVTFWQMQGPSYFPKEHDG